MRPPTPSTRSVTPIRSGATSWTLRAKKLRLSTRVVTHERRKREREQRAANDARNSTGDDREAQARGVRECSRLEIPDRRRRRDLHELDPGHAAEHLARRDAIQHHRAEDRTDLIAEPGEPEQQQREPELLRKPEGSDSCAPQRGGDDHAEPLLADVTQ